MRIFAALCSVILLWSTTPLAIKWSGEGPGFLFGVTGRMVIGLACMLPVLIFVRTKMPWSAKAWLTYGAVAIQIYCAMLSVYWAAQFIPSGWISVIFGLSPMITAIMAAIWLSEQSLSPIKLISYATGLGGLAVMFGSAYAIGQDAAMAIAAVVLSAFLQSASSVMVKRINAKIPAIYQVSGGLMLAVPLYIVTWLYLDGRWPQLIPMPSLISIVYLGAIATTIGFALYYYVLTHLPATRVAMITLVTPVLSLLLGKFVNQEPITEKVLIGSALIMSALLMHQLGDRKKRNQAPVSIK